MVLIVFLLAELLAFLLALAIDSSELGFFSEFGIRSLVILWIALTSSAFLCLIAKPFRKINCLAAGLTAFIAIQLITLLVCWLVSDIFPNWDLLPQFIAEDHKTEFYLRSLGISSLVSTAFLRHLFIQFKWKQQVEAQTIASLEAMQARMKPHFLFNSLNTIASLTRLDPPLAEKLIEDLSELIRASITINPSKMVRFDQEIHFAKLYLEIEIHRFCDKLKITWDIPEKLLDSLMPPLTLQPVIENAVYHGIELNPAGGQIMIKGKLQNSRITIMVRNTLPPTGTHTNRKSNQFALNNLAARMDVCFSGKSSVFKSLADNYYQLTLVYPYIVS